MLLERVVNQNISYNQIHLRIKEMNNFVLEDLRNLLEQLCVLIAKKWSRIGQNGRVYLRKLINSRRKATHLRYNLSKSKISFKRKTIK
jgi:hypothetical protein